MGRTFSKHLFWPKYKELQKKFIELEQNLDENTLDSEQSYEALIHIRLLSHDLMIFINQRGIPKEESSKIITDKDLK